MRKLFAALCFLLATSSLAMAQETAKDTPKKAPSVKQKAQQDKMTACNKEASGKNLKADERKKFMSACLKG